MEKLYSKIESFRGEMCDLQKELIKIPAIGPENGGKGEKEKALFLKGRLQDMGFDFEEYNVFDERISDIRPNIRVRYPGRDSSKTLWIITHLDVVPPGNLSLWETDPFTGVEKDGRIYGRGAEDNHQELIASLFALKALKDLNLKPRYEISLLFVADEETGSKYGISHLLGITPSLFRREDLFLVPDAGNEEGSLIEIAEKTILWLKVIVRGRQTHASTPDEGLNASRLGARLLCQIDSELHKRFKKRNRLFKPPYSTFEPTKRESNVPNINTIPGEDIFYFDCRLLPDIHPNEVKDVLDELKEDFSKEHGCEVSFETILEGESAPATSSKALVVRRLKRAILEVYGVKALLKGIGGGTVAAHFRKRGFPVGVWGKVQGTAHQPNEYCLIDNMVQDAKVYGVMAI